MNGCGLNVIDVSKLQPGMAVCLNMEGERYAVRSFIERIFEEGENKKLKLFIRSKGEEKQEEVLRIVDAKNIIGAVVFDLKSLIDCFNRRA
jgi:pyruvate-formate lyase-activating enzyme